MFKVLVTTSKVCHGTGGTYGHDPTAVGLTTTVIEFSSSEEAGEAVKIINSQRNTKYEQVALQISFKA